MFRGSNRSDDGKKSKEEKKDKKQKKVKKDKRSPINVNNSTVPQRTQNESKISQSQNPIGVNTSALAVIENINIDSLTKQFKELSQQLEAEQQSKNYQKVKELFIEINKLNQHVDKCFCETAITGSNFILIARLFNLRSLITSKLLERKPKDKVLLSIKSGQFHKILYQLYPKYKADLDLPLRLLDYNTHQLVIAYNASVIEPTRKQHIEKIIFGIIEEFSQIKVWTPALMDAVLPLGACYHPRIAKALLEKCLQRLRKSILFDIYLVDHISQLIRFSNHRLPDGNILHVLDGDDLVQVLSVIVEQLEKLCATFFNEEKLKSLLPPLVTLLNTMLDQEVQGLEEINTVPLAEFLRKLFKDENIESDVTFYARYAHQALARLPDKKNALSTYFGCSLEIFRGVVAVGSGAWLMDPNAVLEGIFKLKDSINNTIDVSKRRLQHSWYETLRVIEAFMPSKKQSLQALNTLLCSPNLIQNENIFYGLILKLLPLLNSTNPNLRRQTYGYLCKLTGFDSFNSIRNSNTNNSLLTFKSFKPLIKNDIKPWPIYPSVHGRVLEGLNELPQMNITSPYFLSILELYFRTYLENKLVETINKKESPSNSLLRLKNQLKSIAAPRRVALSSANSSVMQEATHTTEVVMAHEKQLVLNAYQKVLPLDFRIDQIWFALHKRLHESKTINDLSCYVPLKIVKNLNDLENEQIEGLNLDEIVQNFLKHENDIRIAMIHGFPGCGKSLFGKYLIHQLWSCYKPGQKVPLFISLEETRDPYYRLLERTLEYFGCNEDEILNFKRDCEFVLFCDTYNAVINYRNLYLSNSLQNWRVKLIITCRLGYLPINYHHLFETDNHDSMKELFIIPFREQQRNSYLLKLTTAKFSFLNDENEKRLRIETEFVHMKKRLEKLPISKEFMQSPIRLKFITEILTDLEKKQLNEEDDYFSWGNICKAYIARFYEQAEQQIHNSQELKLRKTFQLRPSFQKFGEDLAWTMQVKNQFIVPVVIDEYRTPEEIKENPWERFFNNKDPEIIACRLGIPLEYSTNTVQFVDKSLQEYYVACRLFKEISLNSDEKPLNVNFYFNQIRLDRELAILGFLKDFINYDSDMIEALFNMIVFSEYHSDCECMAANAASLLSYMNIPFSGRKLTNAKISYAKMSNAILDGTDLSNAKMIGVNLTNAWMRNTLFKESNMKDVNLGELPTLKHPEIVKSVVFSPDENSLATASGNNIYLWSNKNGELQHIFNGHENTVTCLAFSSDSKILATGSQDRTVKFWNMNTGQLLLSSTQHSKAVTCINYSHTGNLLVSGSRDGIIRIWDCKTGLLIREFKGSKGWITSVVFYPEDQTIASSSNLDCIIRLWNVQTGLPILSLKNHKGNIYNLAVNTKENLLASASDDNTVCLWDLKTNMLIKAFTGHTKWVISLAFSKNGELLATGSWDNTVRIWNIKTKDLRKIYTGHSLPVQSIAFNDETHLATIGGNNLVRLWSSENIELKRNNTGHTSGVRCIAISKDGLTVVSASIDKTIKAWNAHYGTLKFNILGHEGEVRSIVTNNNGEIISASNDKTIRLWDKKGNLQHIFNGHSREIISLTLSDDNTTLASGSWDNSIRLWNIKTKRELAVLNGHTGTIFSIAFANGNELLISGSQDQTIRVWKLKDGSVVNVLKGHAGEIRCIAINYKDNSIISGSHDRTLRQWNINSGQLIHTFNSQPSERIETVVVSPDRELIAAGCSTTIQLWSLTTKQQIAILTGYQNQINSLAWHSNGNLISGSADNSVKCWKPLKKPNQQNNYNKWHLIWRTHANKLFCEDCQIDKADNLTLLNKQLLAQGGAKGIPPLTLQDFPEWTQLQLDVANNNLEKVKETINIDPESLEIKDSEENTLLHIAVRYRADINLVKWLLEKELRSQEKNVKGMTVLQLAKEFSRHDLLPAFDFNENNKVKSTDAVRLSTIPQSLINTFNRPAEQIASTTNQAQTNSIAPSSRAYS